MYRATSAITTLCVLSLLTGCGRDYRVDPAFHYDASERRGLTESVKPIDLATFKFPEKKNDCCEKTAYAEAATDAGARNRLMAILQERSDRIYEVHIADVLATQAETNLALDIGALTTASLAAVLEPKATKTALATAAAILTGSQSALNERIYFKLLAPRIIRETAEARQAVLFTMQTNRLQPITVYTVDDMLRDLERYHQRGSFAYGVLRLAGDLKDDLLTSTFSLPLNLYPNDEIKLVVENELRALTSQLKLTLEKDGIKVTPEKRDRSKELPKVAVNLAEDEKPADTPGDNEPAKRKERLEKMIKTHLEMRFDKAEFTVTVKTKN